jgi:type II secretory pathway component PulF
MPTFKYRVRDKTGRAIAGTIDAPTSQGAGDQLYNLGYLPISIEEMREAVSLDLSDLMTRFQKVKLEDLMLFSQQLSTLYKAGLPLLTGLMSLKEQIENKKLKLALGDICRQIEGGMTLFGSMSQYPDVFPFVYTNMVRAGETSGMLGESLDRFVTLAERELGTRQKIKEATRYPKIIIAALVIACIVLIGFVIPRFAAVFDRFNTPLPLPTRILIGINTFFKHYWYVILGMVFITPIIIMRYIKTDRGKYYWDKLKAHIPVISPLFLKVALSRFSYTFVMLNRSGIPILQTLEITSSTVNNNDLSKSIEEIIRNIGEGRSLTDAMRESGKFTPLVLQMVSVGESSGTLDQMLIRITEHYDQQVDSSIKKLSTYIEPILTAFMAIVVLFLALAVFMPWWNMASLFK